MNKGQLLFAEHLSWARLFARALCTYFIYSISQLIIIPISPRSLQKPKLPFFQHTRILSRLKHPPQCHISSVLTIAFSPSCTFWRLASLLCGLWLRSSPGNRQEVKPRGVKLKPKVSQRWGWAGLGLPCSSPRTVAFPPQHGSSISHLA